MRHRHVTVTLVCALVSSATAFAQPHPSDPWAALETVRAKLAAAGARSAPFEHTFIPAGFTTGEKETGRLALALPDCLRWDYTEPYPKSFLVCDGVAHYWSSEDASGKRQRIDSKNEPGLDLLLLSAADLALRYSASATTDAQGRMTIHLTPAKALAEVREATLELDLGAGVVAALEYADREGNRTRFAIGAYGPNTDASTFTPPPGITWEDVSPP